MNKTTFAKSAALSLVVLAATGCSTANTNSNTAMMNSNTAVMNSNAMMMNSNTNMGMMNSNAMMMNANASSMNANAGVMVGGAMMVRDKDIVDNASMASNVSTLVAAVQAASLVETLKGAGPFTVFGPTNDAFDKLPTGTLADLTKPESKAQLTKILTYHVVPGRYTAADLKDGQKLKTVQGQELTVTMRGGKVMINNATVETPDVISSNGVTHVIDTVLMPAN